MTFTTVKLDKARNIVLGFKAMQEFKNTLEEFKSLL